MEFFCKNKKTKEYSNIEAMEWEESEGNKIMVWKDLPAIPWSLMERWEQKRSRAMRLRREPTQKCVAFAILEEVKNHRELEEAEQLEERYNVYILLEN